VAWPSAHPLLPLSHSPCSLPPPLRTHRCSPLPPAPHHPSPLLPLLPQAFEKITGHSWDRKKIRWEWTDCDNRSGESTRAIDEPEPERETKSGEWLRGARLCVACAAAGW
jgi:hypothetical protein